MAKITTKTRKLPQHEIASVAARPQRRAVASTPSTAAGKSQQGLDTTNSQAPEPRPTGPGGKLGVIVGLMRRSEGATVVQMSEATDWLPHSVRGALAGAIKKKHKLTVTSVKTDLGRVYRIAPLTVAEAISE